MNKLIMTGLVVVLLCGCNSLYKGIVTITDVRYTALKQLAQLNKEGKISKETDAKIAAADDAFLKSAEATQKALIAFKESGDSVAYVKALQVTKSAVGSILDILLPLIEKQEAIKLQTSLQTATKL